MAVHNSHANQFIQQLNRNERNTLRVLLLTKSGLPDLREVCSAFVTKEKILRAVTGPAIQLRPTKSVDPGLQIEL
jgi:hypothetical protein